MYTSCDVAQENELVQWEGRTHIFSILWPGFTSFWNSVKELEAAGKCELQVVYEQDSD